MICLGLKKKLIANFFDYIKAFPNDQLPYIYELLAKYDNKEIIIFKNHIQLQNYLDDLKRGSLSKN